MKKALYLLSTLAFLILFGACHRDNTNSLDQAEALMESRPDSALLLLNEIRPAELKSEEAIARYYLLKSIALDKNYIDLQDDSLIVRAVNYYTKQALSPYRMKTWYYNGVIESNSGDYNKAIISLERADKDATELGDYYYIGLINRKKAAIFNMMYNLTAAIPNQERALDAFIRAGKEEHADYCRLGLGIQWFNAKEFDKAKSVLLETKASTNNQTILNRCDLRLAAISLEQGEGPDLALSVYRQVPKRLFSLVDYGYYAGACEQAGQIDSADFWMQRGYLMAKDEVDSASLDYMNSWIAGHRGDYLRAYELVDHAEKVQDANTKAVLQESLTTALKDYYKETLTVEEEKAAHLREIRFWEGALGCVLILAICLFFHARLKKKNKLLELQITRYLTVQEEKRGIQLENAQLVGDIFSERIHHIDELSQAYYSADAKKKKDIVFESFKKYLAEFRNDDDAFHALEQDLNRHCDGIMEKLQQQMPQINGEKRRITAMFFAGIPYETIQLIMNRVSVYSLRTLRYRLRLEIEASSAPDKELFLTMLETRKSGRQAKNK